MERQLCSSLNHAGTKYPAGQAHTTPQKSFRIIAQGCDRHPQAGETRRAPAYGVLSHGTGTSAAKIANLAAESMR
jgi:hypothetical protein